MIPNSRPFIHRSTVTKLMLAFGAILWANLIWEWTPNTYISTHADGRTHVELVQSFYGRPIIAVIVNTPDTMALSGNDHYDIHYGYVALDAVFALILLATVWYVYEWRIRRGEDG